MNSCELVAERPVQADLAVGATAQLDALLELAPRRRAATAIASVARSSGGRLGRLQVGEQVARLLRALVAESDTPCSPSDSARTIWSASWMRRRAMRSASSLGRKRAFSDRSIANGRLSGGANISSARAPGNVDALGQRPEHELGLPARARARTRSAGTRPRCSTDASVQRITSPSSGASTASPLRSNTSARGSCRPSTSRLAEPAAERAPHEPLQLRRRAPARTGRKSARRACAWSARTRARSSSRDRQHAPVAQREAPSQRARSHSRGSALGEPRDVRGDVALGIAQAHEHEHAPGAHRRARAGARACSAT